MRRVRTMIPAVVFAPMAAGAVAQEPTDDREWIGGAPLSSWTRLAGDLGGLRTDLEELGIEMSGGYIADLSAPWSGNGSRRSAYNYLIDYNVAFDLEALAGLPRTLAYLDAYSIEGTNPSNRLGDWGGVSNIGGPDVEQLAEAWVETWIDRVRIKAGKVDFNSEFAVNETGGELVNGTGAVPSTIFGYPTFPNPATSVNVFYHPSQTFYVGAAVYDGATAEGFNTGYRGFEGLFESQQSDAYFLCAEVGLAWVGGNQWGSGRVSAGAFQHTGTFSTFSGGTEDGTAGFWAGIEQGVYRENPGDADDEQGIGLFPTVGFSDDDVTGIGSSALLGMSWTGPVPTRDDDVLAFAIMHHQLSDNPAAGTPHDETVFELLYKVQVTPAISLKPELQYLVHPGGAAGVDDTLVALLRLEILF